MTDVPHHDELPLPDYDHLPVGGLAQRIRTLDATALEAVLAYERAHGDRLPVVQVLETRLAEVHDGAPLSEGDPMALASEAPGGEQSSALGSATERPGPPVNPPSHGDPTNPAQPRT